MQENDGKHKVTKQAAATVAISMRPHSQSSIIFTTLPPQISSSFGTNTMAFLAIQHRSALCSAAATLLLHPLPQ